MHWSALLANTTKRCSMVNYGQAPLRTTPNQHYGDSNFTPNSIFDKAKGLWPMILENLGIDALYLKNKHGPCPVCSGKDRFRFDNKNGSGSFYCNQCGPGYGLKLLQLYHGWNFTEALNRVAQALDITSEFWRYTPSTTPSKNIVTKNEDFEWRKKILRATWLRSKPIRNGDSVDCYLKSRRIALTAFPSVLRHHPQLDYYSEDNRCTGCHPAMLALITDKENKGVTLHRTYLGNACKADVKKPKKLMPPLWPRASLGAAIKLYQPTDGTLALAEGIETALSIHIATGIPVWATGSAYGLENIILPLTIREIIIAVDNDESNRGQEAASILTEKLLSEGRRVKRVIPPKIGQDFNDLLLEDEL